MESIHYTYATRYCGEKKVDAGGRFGRRHSAATDGGGKKKGQGIGAGRKKPAPSTGSLEPRAGDGLSAKDGAKGKAPTRYFPAPPGLAFSQGAWAGLDDGGELRAVVDQGGLRVRGPEPASGGGQKKLSRHGWRQEPEIRLRRKRGSETKIRRPASPPPRRLCRLGFEGEGGGRRALEGNSGNRQKTPQKTKPQHGRGGKFKD